MPIYEFRCPRCGQHHELLCRLGEDGADLRCQSCGTVGLKKLISLFSSPSARGGSSSCASCSGGSCATCR